MQRECNGAGQAISIFGHDSSIGRPSLKIWISLLRPQHRKSTRTTHLELLQKLIVALVAHRRHRTSWLYRRLWTV